MGSLGQLSFDVALLGTRMLPSIAGLMTLGLAQCCVVYALPRLTPSWNWRTPGTSDDKDSLDAYLIVYNVITTLAMVLCSILGVYGLLDGEFPADNLMYGSSPTSVLLMQVQMGYQMWNVVSALFHPKLNTPIMIGHHTTTSLLAIFMTYPFGHGYLWFFFGVSEFSTVWLCCMDISDSLPMFHKSPAGVYANKLFKAIFAISFIVLRLIWWPIVCWESWSIIVQIAQSDAGPPNGWIPMFVITGSNIFLTLLQFVFGKVVVTETIKVITTGKVPDTDDIARVDVDQDQDQEDRGGQSSHTAKKSQ